MRFKLLENTTYLKTKKTVKTTQSCWETLANLLFIHLVIIHNNLGNIYYDFFILGKIYDYFLYDKCAELSHQLWNKVCSGLICHKCGYFSLMFSWALHIHHSDCMLSTACRFFLEFFWVNLLAYHYVCKGNPCSPQCIPLCAYRHVTRYFACQSWGPP